LQSNGGGKTLNKTVVLVQVYYLVRTGMFPQIIIQKEILPYSQDPNYLSTHNMEWNEGRVRQNLVSKTP
jgi:murein L,D-transpeptidase YcbB/YkuD